MGRRNKLIGVGGDEIGEVWPQAEANTDGLRTRFGSYLLFSHEEEASNQGAGRS